MTGSSPKIEVLDGPQRRRHWTAAEKLTIVQETYEGTGGSVKAGTNIRADHNGRPIPDGTDMVNLVTLEREDASSAWKVTGNQVGYKPSCDVEKVS